ncbi:MAG: peptidoglycan endopeptidase, partial [Treponema sp.]|nr:peptidoglycan endopeptidase [Treponema sp.]
KHGDRTVAAGTATHICGFVDDSVVLNSEQPTAKVRYIMNVSNWFQKEGYETVVRGLDRSALERLAKEGKTVYELDKEFHDFFNVRA